MTFQSITFIPFLAVLLCCLRLVNSEKIRQFIILLASAFFYGLWGWRFLALITICIFIIHMAGRVLRATTWGGGYRKRICSICITLLLLILGIFKYFNFFMAEFCSLLGIEQSISTHLMLPIGISFYIFSAIGYIIDTYRGDITEAVPFYQEALYVLFFPKILQGPLHKATDFMSQLKEEHPITWINVSSGLQIFLFGLIKKIVIADRLGLFVDTVYATPKAFSGLTLLLAALTYPIQLYCDFSGYSDMAVGTAKMMGYNLCPNFNLPFLSKTVAEYWRRWHMSLNIWFRDYLFYPVVRSNWVNELRKKTKAKSKKFSKIVPSIIGMTIVWPLIGLWHGASWNFILHGTCYGILMILGQIFSEYKSSNVSSGLIFDVLRIIRTFVITIILLIIFRMPNFSDVRIVLSRIITMEVGINYFYTWSLLFIPIVFALLIFAYVKNGGNGYYIELDLTKFKNKVIFCTVVLLTIIFMHVGENYFMYFKF